jgi:hypothetical protein
MASVAQNTKMWGVAFREGEPVARSAATVRLEAVARPEAAQAALMFSFSVPLGDELREGNCRPWEEAVYVPVGWEEESEIPLGAALLLAVPLKATEVLSRV